MAATTQQNPANQLVLEERDGNIATLRLNRPDRLNALNVELGRELVHALIRAGEDKGVAAVRIIGAGRGFWRAALRSLGRPGSPARAAALSTPGTSC